MESMHVTSHGTLKEPQLPVYDLHMTLLISQRGKFRSGKVAEWQLEYVTLYVDTDQ